MATKGDILSFLKPWRSLILGLKGAGEHFWFRGFAAKIPDSGARHRFLIFISVRLIAVSFKFPSLALSVISRRMLLDTVAASSYWRRS
jgi:hypothetical protein